MVEIEPEIILLTDNVCNLGLKHAYGTPRTSRYRSVHSLSPQTIIHR
jgi:hypothetical protein